MLEWKKGPHAYDGVWGKYWYRKVNESSSFVKSEEPSSDLSLEEQTMVKAVEPFYKKLEKHKIFF
jgi:hypothetical protein